MGVMVAIVAIAVIVDTATIEARKKLMAIGDVGDWPALAS